MKRSRLKRVQVKRRRTGPPRRSSRVLDPAYLAWLRTLACWSCFQCVYEVCDSSWWEAANCEAAHIGREGDTRGVSQKYGDDTAIPLCPDCHQHGPLSIHKVGAVAFFSARGTSRDVVILMFRKLYADTLE